VVHVERLDTRRARVDNGAAEPLDLRDIIRTSATVQDASVLTKRRERYRAEIFTGDQVYQAEKNAPGCRGGQIKSDAPQARRAALATLVSTKCGDPEELASAAHVL